MAGDWLKMRARLAEDRAVMLMCDLTGLDQFAVVGRLHAIWSWAGEHTVTGHVPGVTLATVDRVTCHAGFASAMVAAEWLEVPESGGLVFPQWKKFNGKAAKERALAAVRQARKRAKSHGTKRDGKRDGSVTSHAPREEKRREEKNTSPNGEVGAVLPPSLDVPEFRTEWTRWLDWRKAEKKKAVSASAAKSQLAELARYGPAVAIEAIRNSIKSDWQGLFPEKVNANGNRTNPAGPGQLFDPQRTLGPV